MVVTLKIISLMVCKCGVAIVGILAVLVGVRVVGVLTKITALVALMGGALDALVVGYVALLTLLPKKVMLVGK